MGPLLVPRSHLAEAAPLRTDDIAAHARVKGGLRLRGARGPARQEQGTGHQAVPVALAVEGCARK
eukprot:5826130-Lingulodinium_polyedra.AAC.1